MATTDEESGSELDPFAAPADDGQSIEGKVALELIPDMRRATHYQQAGARSRSPWGVWSWLPWVLLGGFLLGATAVVMMRLLA